MTAAPAPKQAARLTRLSRLRRRRRPSTPPNLGLTEPLDRRSATRAPLASNSNGGPRTSETPERKATSETPEKKAQRTGEATQPGVEPADKTRPESAASNRTGAAPQVKPGGAGAGKATAKGKVNIPQEKASQIVERLTRTTTSSHVNVATNIGVAINVGVAIPADVTLVPVTPEVVTLVPQFSGYDYVVAQGEVLIVEPSSRQVVEIISETGNVASASGTVVQPGPAAQITLTDAQQQLLIQSIHGENLAPAPVADVANGVTVEQSVELAPMPQAVVEQVPTIERYRLFVTNNGGVALVDPDTRTVVDVIE